MDTSKLQTQVNTLVENVVYLIACILTLGGIWLMKIVIKKAVIEANASQL